MKRGFESAFDHDVSGVEGAGDGQWDRGSVVATSSAGAPPLMWGAPPLDVAAEQPQAGTMYNPALQAPLPPQAGMMPAASNVSMVPRAAQIHLQAIMQHQQQQQLLLQQQMQQQAAAQQEEPPPQQQNFGGIRMVMRGAPGHPPPPRDASMELFW